MARGDGQRGKIRNEDRTCLGWPEVGSCGNPAQNGHRHRKGRWSPRYCVECDELRALHAGLADETDREDEGD